MRSSAGPSATGGPPPRRSLSSASTTPWPGAGPSANSQASSGCTDRFDEVCVFCVQERTGIPCVVFSPNKGPEGEWYLQSWWSNHAAKSRQKDPTNKQLLQMEARWQEKATGPNNFEKLMYTQGKQPI